MSEFNYEKVAKEIGWSFDKVNYTCVQDVDFNYYEQVKNHIKNKTVMLDIGCGSAEKACKFFADASKIFMIDTEIEMLKKAKENVSKLCESVQQKFVLSKASGLKKLKFEDESLDLVVSRHCGANMKEVFRVLKKGGFFISQDIDKEDCWDLKQIFNRGQCFDKKISVKEKTLKQILKLGFTKIEVLNFTQTEYYKTKEDVIFLLKRTPILNGFNEIEDEKLLNLYIQKFSTNNGIQLNRKLYALKLTK